MASLQIVLMCRNRLEGALRAVAAIIGQLEPSFTFIVSDNSSNALISDSISTQFPGVELKTRGGGLTQFDHMSIIIQESSSDFLLITHDDDVLFDNFVSVAYSAIRARASLGVLLNRVIPYNPKKTPKVMTPGDKKTFGDFCDYNFKAVMQDYLIGRFRIDFYSISMTVFNTKLAHHCLDSLRENGNHADGCFIIQMCSMGDIVLNKTPVGAYEMSQDSVSNTLTLNDSKLFLRFLIQQGLIGAYYNELSFFKLRTRFFYARKHNSFTKYKFKLFLSLLRFVLNPSSAEVIVTYFRRKVECLFIR